MSALNTSPADLNAIARMAAGLYVRRQRKAGDMVRSGAIAAIDANRALTPWLAIASLCGADLPELTELLADRVITDPAGRKIVAERVARILIADEICARARWAGLLAKARDEALDANPATPDDLCQARALIAVAAHLAHDPNRRHPVPPYRPRIAPAAAHTRRAA